MTTTVTLADVAANSAGAVRVLEGHGLDYCCGGKRAFVEACAAKNLSPESVLQEIAAAGRPSSPQTDWQTAPLDQLIEHILKTHHDWLRQELPALSGRLAKVHQVHGARDRFIGRMVEVFSALRQELEMHMRKEELVLFPAIKRYAFAAANGLPLPPVPFGSIANPISAMEQEHSDAGGALAELRNLTVNYTLPAYACNTVKALYAGLEALEADLHVHIHLENNILFPRAIALEGTCQ